MSVGDRMGRRVWLSWGAIFAGAACLISCDAVIGIPGDLRDRAANGALREGRFGTLPGDPLTVKGPDGAPLVLSRAALERRGPEGAPGCAQGLCLRGSLSARGGGQ